ncbi:uncharacterized protein LOC111019900 [Momordica charantia]|uniref:Uncharacterized protein LOC111019900 n=1 Tax=Momordica charantia TaxID=3673 RepID=A0A6J1DGM8_MOMCH|nr:uncharacterized protein LOC111019900 [Momordica charantia]
MDSSKTLSDNLDDFKKLSSEFNSLGEKIGAENEAFILLNSLPESYREVKVALKYGRESITTDAIISAVKTKELELQPVAVTTAATTIAAAATITATVTATVTGPLTIVATTVSVAATVPGTSTVVEADKFEKDNKTILGHLLNHMNNSLFYLFVVQKSAKIIWDMFESRYGGDDADRRKYVVGKWLEFQMSDDESVMNQVHEYENLVASVLSKGMKMCEILQANVLLEKFPYSWSDYHNHLKHKKKDLTLQELISHVRTEEANRLKDKLFFQSLNSVKANLVESSSASKDGFKNKGKQIAKDKAKKNKGLKPKNTCGRIEKSKLVCYVCGK